MSFCLSSGVIKPFHFNFMLFKKKMMHHCVTQFLLWIRESPIRMIKSNILKFMTIETYISCSQKSQLRAEIGPRTMVGGSAKDYNNKEAKVGRK